MNKPLRWHWLAMFTQTVTLTGPQRSFRLTGAPAVAVILAVLAIIVAFIVRFLMLRRQTRAAKGVRVEVEAALARSEARYRLLFDHNPCPMCVCNSSTSAILEVNDAAVAQYGYSRDEFARMTLRDLELTGSFPVTSPRRDSTSGIMRATRHRTKSGKAIDVEVQEHSLAADSNHTLVVLTDVTERRAAERNARDAESRARATSEVLQSLFDVAPLAIVVVDADWRVTQWNPAAEALFGWSAQETVGRASPFLTEDLTPEARARRIDAELSTYGSPQEATRPRKNGTPIDVLVASAPLVDAAGKRSGSIAVFTDLTERKMLEEQLRQSQKMEAIGTFAGGIAHDFNNILTIITSYSSMLLAETRDEIDRTSLEEIATATKRATELTRQLLTFSRKAVVRLRAVSINDVVQNMKSMLRRLMATNIEVVTTLTPGLGFVVADPGQIEQIIMNLAVNASDAMPDGGTLVIETRDMELDDVYARMHTGVRPGMYVMLAVSDSGTGMDPETVSKIFEPFFTTKEVGRGTGLGLATVYAIINQLGGHIWVYSELGQGTTFKLYLPRDGTRRSSATPVSAPVVPTSAATVLLVEDDEPVRRAVRRMLERHGHTVIEAADGEEGLSVASSYEGTLNVVVTDLMMPKMNGRTFAAELEKHRPGLPVVFTSGYTDSTVVQRGLIGPHHTFIQKPFTGEQLAKTINEVLSAES